MRSCGMQRSAPKRVLPPSALGYLCSRPVLRNIKFLSAERLILILYPLNVFLLDSESALGSREVGGGERSAQRPRAQEELMCKPEEDPT